MITLLSLVGEEIEQYKVSFGSSYSQIDSAYMPTTGAVATLSGSATLPIGDAITYYQISSSATGYYKLATYDEQPIVLRGRLIAKYAKDYQNESEDIPFFTRYHAGGLGTVRVMIILH